jgi:hypothetical protein
MSRRPFTVNNPVSDGKFLQKLRPFAQGSRCVVFHVAPDSSHQCGIYTAFVYSCPYILEIGSHRVRW